LGVRYYDSVQKIKNQLLLLTNEVRLSLKFFRSYKCVEKCCACCPKFSLDYFEGERWEGFKKSYPEEVKYFKKRLIDGFTVYSDFQKSNKSYFCKYLDLITGRCKIHKYNPFSCDFELIKVTKFKSGAILIKKKYSRDWNMERLDGKKGALCKILPFNYKQFLKDISLLEELNDISNQFKIKTKLPDIINFLVTNKGLFKDNQLLSENEYFSRKNKEGRGGLSIQNFLKLERAK